MLTQNSKQNIPKNKKTSNQFHNKSQNLSPSLKTNYDMYIDLYKIPQKQISYEKKQPQNFDKTPKKKFTFQHNNQSDLKDIFPQKKSSYQKENIRNIQQKCDDYSMRKNLKDYNRLYTEVQQSYPYQKMSNELGISQYIKEYRNRKQKQQSSKKVIQVRQSEVLQLIQRYQRLKIDHEKKLNELNFLMNQKGDKNRNIVIEVLKK